jgi:hypothetical protein
MLERRIVLTSAVWLMCILLVSAGVAAGADVEPNNDSDSATPLSPGERVPGSLSPGDGDFADWYAVEIDDGAAVTVSFTQSGERQFIFRLYRPDGLPIAQEVTEQGTVVRTVTVSEAGTYHVQVFYGDGEYELTVDVEPVSSGETDADTSEESADSTGGTDDASTGGDGDEETDGVSNPLGALNAPAPATGPVGEFGALTEIRIGVEMVGRERPGIGYYQAGATNVDDVVVGEIELTGPDAAEFDWSGIAVGQRLAPGETVAFDFAFAPVSPGDKRATLRIVSERGSVVTFELSGVGLPPDAFEDNENFEDAAFVPHGTHEAAISGHADLDFFAYELDSGDRVTISLSNREEVPLRYFLASPGPRRLTEVTDIGPERTVAEEFVAPRDGTYYVIVGAALTEADAGTDRFELDMRYTLTIEANTPPSEPEPSSATTTSTTSTSFPGFGAVAVVAALAVLALGVGATRLRR